MRLLTKTIITVCLFLAQGCGNDIETEDSTLEEDDTEEQIEEALEDYDRDKEIEALRAELEGSEEDGDSPYLWTIDEIEREIMHCEDDIWYDNESTIENPERFCMCRTEMLSVRWSFDDYKHHPFSYVDFLERSNRLDRCTEPSKYSQPDEPEEIAEDSEFLAE